MKILESWQQWGRNANVESKLADRARGRLPEMESTKQLVKLVAAEYRPGMKVLDVGCNTGHYLRGLRRLDPELHYVGVDAYEEYISQAADIFRDDPHARFEVKDIHESLYTEDAFDIVFCCNVLLHLPDFRLPVKNLLNSTRLVCFIRTLLGECTTIVQKAEANEYDERGQPREYLFQNTWNTEYFSDYIRQLGWDVKVLADDYNPTTLDQEYRLVKKKRGTRILDGMQVDGNILFPWKWVRASRA